MRLSRFSLLAPFVSCLLFIFLNLSCDDGNGISASDSGNPAVTSDDAFLVNADRQNWIKRIIAGTPDWITSTMQRTSDGGIVICCPLESQMSGIDVLIVKLDRAGLIQWQKRFATVNDDVSFSVCQSSDGGYFLAGDGYLLKLSPDGNAQWARYYDAGAIVQVENTGDGGCIAIGTLFVMKLDLQGGVQWLRRFDQSSWNINTKIRQTREGGYILVSADESCNPEGGYQTRLRKLDRNGLIEWEKSYENPYRAGFLDASGEKFDASMSMNDIVQTPDGGFILAGQTESSPLEQLLYTDRDTDIAVMKLDTRGRIQWCRTFGRSLYLVGDICDFGVSVIKTPDGGYAILGESMIEYEKDMGDDSEPVAVDDSWIWLLRLKADGTLQWATSYDDDNKGSIPERLSFIEKADAVIGNSYGGFTVLGRSFSYDEQGEIMLLNLDSGGRSPETSLDVKRTNAVARRYYPIVASMTTQFEEGSVEEGTVHPYDLTDSDYRIEDL